MKQKGSVKFKKGENEFYQTLKKRVNSYFSERNFSKNANGTMIAKTVIMLFSFFFLFFCICMQSVPFGISLIFWFCLGLVVAGIGMSVMHDANHGAYSSNKKVNKYMGYTLGLLGGHVFNWKLQHNVLHHTYTNITDLDDDIDNKVVLRLSPHVSLRNMHRLQYIYAFFLYGITTLYWVVAKDIVQLRKYTLNGVNPNSKSQNKTEWVKLIATKVLYFAFMIGLPIYFGIVWWQVLIGFLLMHAAAGVVLTVVFQLAHSVNETEHPMPDENGNMENNWAIHQMKTTVNFAMHNKLISWYVGGLNFQVEHHLFPKICHVHYPGIAKIVKKTAEEFNVPYLVNHTLKDALQSHLELLRKLGKVPSLNDAIG